MTGKDEAKVKEQTGSEMQVSERKRAGNEGAKSRRGRETRTRGPHVSCGAAHVHAGTTCSHPPDIT